MLKLTDIAVNWTDGMFRGIYRDKICHKDDSLTIMGRAIDAGVHRILMTGTSLISSKECIEYADEINRKSFGMSCRTTVGCHPTQCNEFLNNDKYMDCLVETLSNGIKRGIVTAVGEIGLDYERLHFCQLEVQKKYFEKQSQIFSKFNLPFFLHFRGNCLEDFVEVTDTYQIKGVVHSFTGNLYQMKELIKRGFYIGINGCSLKTDENIQVIKEIPVERIMVETDSPWCEIRPSHAGHKYLSETRFFENGWNPTIQVKKEKFNDAYMVKGRNEPCQVRSILRIIAGIKQMDEKILADIIELNSDLFFSP